MQESPLIFVTGNKNKALQAEKYLKHQIIHTPLNLVEIQDLDPEKVVLHKAKEAFSQLKKPLIVEDTSLIIHGMGKLPGTFIKFFEKEVGYENICRMTDTFSSRSAEAIVVIGYTDGVTSHVSKGSMTGTIASHPKGEAFGWDVIFIPDGYTQSRGEMKNEDFDATSPRKIAFEQLGIFLNTL